MTKRNTSEGTSNNEPWPEWGHPGARDQRYSVGLWDPGTIVRVARAYAGLSQRELAVRTGLALSTISRLESSRSSPRFSIVYQCIEVCGLRIALVGPDAEIVKKAPLVLSRDAAGRNYPAHLKVYRVDKPWQWWNGDGRQPRVVKLSECPPYSFRHWWGHGAPASLAAPRSATRRLGAVTMSPALDNPLSDVTASEASLRRFLHGLPGVDQVGAEARAAGLATRSIKTTAKQFAIDLAISMIDLTTLEGQDTEGKVRALCAKALRPDPTDRDVPRVAAICVYPDLVGVAKEALAASAVKVASVATGFPSGRTSLAVKEADTRDAVAAGADEVDMVIDRGAFLAGRYGQVFDEIAAVKQAAGSAHLKVILETGELTTYDNVRRASWLAMLAGADFIKTSTGKVAPAATLPVTLIMLEAVRDFRDTTERQVGVKPAGGIRTSKDAIKYLVLVNETAGPDWLDPDWFRIGASSLLNDLLMQRQRMTTGRYAGPDYFTLD